MQLLGTMPVPDPDAAIVVAAHKDLRVGAEGQGGGPGRDGPACELLSGWSNPDGNFVTARSNQSSGIIETPGRRHLFQGVPFNLLLGVKVPVAQDARLLNRPESSIRSKAKAKQIAIRMERPQTVTSENQ